MSIDSAVETAPLEEAAPVAPTTSGGLGKKILRHLGTPVAIAVVLFVLYLWVHSQTLDSIERRSLNGDTIQNLVYQHLKLSIIATFFVVIIAIPLGILLSRSWARWMSPGVIALANLGQAIPSIGLMVLLTIWLGIGVQTAVIALVAYSILPVLRNTMVGIKGVDPALIEAARGMGMTRRQVLVTVELRLAVPVILAGLRTALVLAVATATLATFINAGGLGDLIVNGIKLDRTSVLVSGAVLTCCIAFLIDWLGNVAEDVLRPRGL